MSNKLFSAIINIYSVANLSNYGTLFILHLIAPTMVPIVIGTSKFSHILLIIAKSRNLICWMLSAATNASFSAFVVVAAAAAVAFGSEKLLAVAKWKIIQILDL